VNVPVGVEVIDLLQHEDDRGWLAEIYREEWLDQPLAIQWSMYASLVPNARGMHLHPRQDDYLVVAEGAIWLGLYDLRPSSSTAECSALLELGTNPLRAVTIPRGVAHTVISLAHSTVLIGVNRGYEPGVDLYGCRWDDPELGLDWPPHGELALSERDRLAPSLDELRRQLDAKDVLS